MDVIFVTGLIGSLVLVIGAAYPDTKVSKSVYSIKDWLLGLGGIIMLAYSWMNYTNGGPIFFVFLEGLVLLASIFMMADIDDRIDTPILVLVTLGFIIWSLMLFKGYTTIFFIIGLSGVAIGYALEGGSLKREVALLFGSILIALFSYLEASWIFFWLNTFFAVFSGYYVLKMAR